MLLEVIDEVLPGLKPSDTLNDEEYLNKVYAKIVKCNFDGASVMSGSVSGVQMQMKERQNSLIYMHCTVHRFVRDSSKFDNYLDRIDDIINIFKFYYYSPLRRKELNDLVLLFDEHFKQFGLLKNIRWLSSRSTALIF